MKAISLWQPWAQLVALGAKSIETRSWPTGYRGPIAIHATVGFPDEARELCGEEPFASMLHGAGYHANYSLPLGVVVATARLVDVRPISWGSFWVENLSDQERAFGDYSPGRFGWILADVRMLVPHVPVRGKQGLWEWDERSAAPRQPALALEGLR